MQVFAGIGFDHRDFATKMQPKMTLIFSSSITPFVKLEISKFGCTVYGFI